MAKIVHKLNLNKTPQLVDDNSMIFAKNIMLGKDGTIRRDKAMVEILSTINNKLYLSILGDNTSAEINKIQLIGKSYNDDPEGDNEKIIDSAKIDEYTYIIESTSEILDNNPTIGSGFNNYFADFNIIEIIPYNTKFYILCKLTTDCIIIEYDELNNTIKPYYTAWIYSGGTITGNCSINLRNEVILTIAESGADIDVPLKTINLSKAKYTDDESWYTQTPILDIFNLNLVGRYQKSIPNGVYQFFARFEISENNYTNWFIVSNELFAGNNTILHTHQGSVNYLNEHIDSDESFILQINKLFENKHYNKVQLGFLLSHDSEIYARSWKTIDFENDINIYFDYNQEDIKEIDVNDLLKIPYNIYNARNVTQFKNKQYIANYKETDFNPEFSGYAKNIQIGVKQILLPEFTSSIVINPKHGTSISGDIKFTKQTESQHNAYYISHINNNSFKNYVYEALKHCTGYNTSAPTELCKQLTLKSTPYGGAGTNNTENGFIKFVLYGWSTPIGRTYTEYKNDYFEVNGYVFTDFIKEFPNLINQIIFKYLDNEEATASDKYKILNDNNQSIEIELTRYTFLKEQPTYFTSKAWFKIDISDIEELTLAITDNSNNNNLKYYNTLIPEQGYDFYVHFGKNTGEVTNGYYVTNIKITDDNVFKFMDDEFYDWKTLASGIDRIYIPVFSNIVIPDDYDYCYFSIKHVSNKFGQICNIKSIPNLEEESTNNVLIGNNIEHNLRLLSNINKSVTVNLVIGSGTELTNTTLFMDFKHSAEGSELLTFGSSGLFINTDAPSETYKDNGYFILPYSSDNSVNDLVKCTPYIKSTISTTDIIEIDESDLNLLGFLNAVVFLKDNTSQYVSGGDKYNKQITSQSSGKTLILVDSSFIENPIENNTVINRVFSSNNLSYLSLSEGVNFTPKTVTKTITTEGQLSTTKILAIATDSINLSDVYTLPKMYKEYTRYLCTKRENNTITKFDNTIRSSKLETDEDTLNRFIFESTDYYNVPTTKGIITNLVAVGNAILVHTQDSLFKFVGNNTLTANGGEDVQLKESEVFDTGITEVFGSEFGYAGLKDKKHSIITELGYIFFDYDAKVLYLYAGEGQVSAISEPIDKLLKHANIQNVYFANDYYNDRFLISIVFNNINVLEYATLSFNYKAKSFISLHDFKFSKSFSTKTKCYLLHTTENAIDKIIEYGTFEISSTENPIDEDFIMGNDNLYPAYNIDDDGAIKASIVDIIFNTSYETIKALNNISWVCNNIIKFTEIGQDINGIDNMAEENLNSEYKGDYLRLYTDTTATDLINLSGRSNDEHLINQNVLNEDSYKLPRYNKGRWNLNYFRNILNTTQTHFNKNNYRDSDNHSLIYGKYIVARFIFDNSVNDFKFENIEFNVSTYE